jgi:predicted nuclease with TOPRIM domain
MAWPKSFHPVAVIEELKRKLASIQEQGGGTGRENEQLRKENEQLRQQREQLEQERERWQQERERLRQERERLRQENEKLKRQLEEAQRASKRHRSLAVDGNRTQNRPGASPALPMASVITNPFLSRSMK